MVAVFHPDERKIYTDYAKSFRRCLAILDERTFNSKIERKYQRNASFNSVLWNAAFMCYRTVVEIHFSNHLDLSFNARNDLVKPSSVAVCISAFEKSRMKIEQCPETCRRIECNVWIMTRKFGRTIRKRHSWHPLLLLLLLSGKMERERERVWRQTKVSFSTKVNSDS